MGKMILLLQIERGKRETRRVNEFPKEKVQGVDGDKSVFPAFMCRCVLDLSLPSHTLPGGPLNSAVTSERVGTFHKPL